MIKCIIFDFYNVLYPYSPEAEETVQAVRDQGYKLGAISSLSPEKVQEIAEHYKIDHVFSSCATCLSKTDPLIYERFLQEFNFASEECVMIDDDQSRLAAAKQVGIKTIWLKLSESDRSNSTDIVINKIQELKEIKL